MISGGEYSVKLKVDGKDVDHKCIQFVDPEDSKAIEENCVPEKDFNAFVDHFIDESLLVVRTRQCKDEKGEPGFCWDSEYIRAVRFLEKTNVRERILISTTRCNEVKDALSKSTTDEAAEKWTDGDYIDHNNAVYASFPVDCKKAGILAEILAKTKDLISKCSGLEHTECNVASEECEWKPGIGPNQCTFEKNACTEPARKALEAKQKAEGELYDFSRSTRHQRHQESGQGAFSHS